MNPERQESILAIALPAQHGKQRTIAPVLEAALASSLWTSGSRATLVPWNLPPAAVWIYTRQQGKWPC